MKPTPLVSILTPSFNQARWLGDNLRSVACQSYPNIEHIVMDGGSTDGSVEILQAASGTVRWQSEPDRGQSHALNKAYRLASGDFIGWLNSDDAYFACDVVERVVAHFERHPDVAVVFGHAARVNADGRLINIAWVPRFWLRMFRWFDYIFQPAVFMRRSCLLNDELVDESVHFAMDYKLFLTLSNAGHRFSRLSRVLAIDRLHGARKSQTAIEVFTHDIAMLTAEGFMDGVPSWWWHVWRWYQIGVRWAGLPMALTLPVNRAYTAVPESRAKTVWRQVLARRSKMPEEERWL